MIKVGLLGATGRMGKSILQCLEGHPRCVAVAACGSPGNSTVGLEMGTFFLSGEAQSVIQAADVVIDFSTPEAFDSHLDLAVILKKPIVIGTTGLSSKQKERLSKEAQYIPLVYATNTSIGVTVLTALVQQAAKLLDTSYDIEIVDAHHRHKVDAPSGTALTLGEAIAKGRDISLGDWMIQGTRQGKRTVGDIGFSVQRGGALAGEHTVRFLGDDEVIEFSHRGLSRDLFAKGAIHAAEWIAKDCSPGLYSMNDVLEG